MTKWKLELRSNKVSNKQIDQGKAPEILPCSERPFLGDKVDKQLYLNWKQTPDDKWKTYNKTQWNNLSISLET